MKRLALLLILLAIWSAGLMAFASRIERSTPADEPPVADAIVALTGGSSVRLEAAMRLLEDGRGKRLLISGVYRKASRKDVEAVVGGIKPIYECCVDLGYEAETTLGNGVESADWARGKAYRRLIVVTADYHMPRALIELHAAMPEATLIPYPVVTDSVNVRRWWKSGAQSRRLILEYSKYLAILAREGFLSLGPKDAPADEATRQALKDTTR